MSLACGPTGPEPQVLDHAAVTRMQIEASSALREAVPETPTGESTQRREIRKEDLDILVDASAIRDVYQAWLVDSDHLTVLNEAMEPWVKGDALLTIAPIEDTNKPALLFEIDRPGLVQLPGFDGNFVKLQDLAPISAALARYRQSVGVNWPGFLPARIKIKISFPPYACTFEDNRQASSHGDIVHGCVEINGREFCGDPEGTAGGARYDSEGMAGLETCVADN